MIRGSVQALAGPGETGSATKLETKYVEKPWGRTALPPLFDPPPDTRVGEVWFVGCDDLPLLGKYLFTSEKLSVQVHPDDRQARARGLQRGKSECWYILDAEPGARIGLGLRRATSAEALRQAALDGSIESMIDWRPVEPGDFFYVAPGTIHAIGGGLSLLEFQQNSDITYRLYDYGRPRELHLDDAVAVAAPSPFPEELAKHVGENEECVLVDGPDFILVHSLSDCLEDRRRWVFPIDGSASSDGARAAAGECLLLEPHQQLTGSSGRLLVGAESQR